MIIRRLYGTAQEREFEVSPSDREPRVLELLRELDALRGRLDQAGEWFRRPQDTLKAGALAEEVKRLCLDASRSDEEDQVAALLARARECLDELQILLGSH